MQLASAWYPDPVLYVPAWHVAHPDCPSIEAYFPAPQAMHAVDDTAPSCVLLVPWSHTMQLASALYPDPVPYMPAWHIEHPDCPPIEAYFPALQAMHVVEDATPSCVLLVPSSHAMQLASAWYPDPVPYVPAWHIAHPDCPSVEAYFPALQAMQSSGMGEPVFGFSVPTGQSEQIPLDVPPVPVAYVPAAQTGHVVGSAMPVPVQ